MELIELKTSSFWNKVYPNLRHEDVYLIEVIRERGKVSYKAVAVDSQIHGEMILTTPMKLGEFLEVVSDPGLIMKGFGRSVDWNAVSLVPGLLTRKAREKLRDKLHWTSIASHTHLDKCELENNFINIDWGTVLTKRHLPENFLAENLHRLPIHHVCVHQVFSVEFVMEYADSLDLLKIFMVKEHRKETRELARQILSVQRKFGDQAGFQQYL